MFVKYNEQQSILRMDKDGILFHDKNPIGQFNGKNAVVLGRTSRLQLEAGKWETFPYYADILSMVSTLVICTKDEVLMTGCYNRYNYATRDHKGYKMYLIPRSDFVYAQVKGVNA